MQMKVIARNLITKTILIMWSLINKEICIYIRIIRLPLFNQPKNFQIFGKEN